MVVLEIQLQLTIIITARVIDQLVWSIKRGKVSIRVSQR